MFFKISSRAGTGTTIEVFIPIPAKTVEASPLDVAGEPPRLPAPVTSPAAT